MSGSSLSVATNQKIELSYYFLVGIMHDRIALSMIWVRVCLFILDYAIFLSMESHQVKNANHPHLDY